MAAADLFLAMVRATPSQLILMLSWDNEMPHCIAGTEDNSHFTQESLIGLR
jgi:hypothetical protein